MCETKTKVHDIAQEVYKNLCEMRTAAQLLQDLGYPSLRENCLDCLGRIESDLSSKTCQSCQRGCHSQCLQILANLHYQIKKKLATGIFECLSCIQHAKCIECKNLLDPDDKRTYACRICLRRVHQRCHKIPLKVMQNGNERKFANLKLSSNVCSSCLSRYGVKDVVDTLKFNLKNYLLVQVNHPSPIHLTWIEESQLNSKSQNTQNVLVHAEPEIQTVLSMHVPEYYANATVDGVLDTLNQQDFLCSSFPMKNTLKFLTKWRHNHSGLVWQQMRVFQNDKIHILKFIHQLKMNDIASHLELPPLVLEKYLADCIHEYAQTNNLNLAKRTINDSNLEEKLVFSNENETVQMDHIYQIYCKKYKQYLNIKKADVKAETMCDLIKMIYFVERNPFPVVIFADETKISWWMGSTMQRLPYLSVLALHGSQQYIENLVQTHLFKPKQEGFILRFNILVVSYQCLKIVSNLFDFKQTLQGFSLMIFDEKMNGLGKHYYDHVKIARIKFHKDNREDTPTKSTDRNDLTESQPNSQKKSSLTLSSSRLKLLAQKSNNSDHQKQSRPIANIITDQFYEGFYHNNQSFTARLLSKFARVVFLRYVHYFGLNANSKQQIYNKMIQIQPDCFKEPKQDALAKLEKHLNYFIAYVIKYKGYINADIKDYLFFDSKSKQIIKIIADLARLKDFCSIFQTNPLFQLKIQKPSLALQDVVILKKWQTKFDYYICKLVLTFGVGKWQKMSQTIEDWNKDGKPCTLRLFLCQESGINHIGSKYFSEFLRIRTKEIAFALEKGLT